MTATLRRWAARQGERGSAAIEAAILVPAFTLFVGLLIFAGRTAVAHQGVQAVAADAARSASIARTPPQAWANAKEALAYSLANNNLRCASSTVNVQFPALAAPIGTPHLVTATVTCTINLADLSIPGVPGSSTVTATMVSPADAWRAIP